jgi:2-polyprenyl-3-methyl-5-hydroxy-6-metoxy-1,4-benzoquinol methylase
MRIIPKPFHPWFIIGDNNGQVSVERQYSGLHVIDFAGKTVLEIGCAEGLVALENRRRGAAVVHGVEYLERAVEVARSLAGVLGVNDHVKFFQGDVRDLKQMFGQPGMLPVYDIVLAMAVLQKVPNQERSMADLLRRCGSTFVIRLPMRRLHRHRLIRTGWSWGACDPVEVAVKNGFELKWESCGYPRGEPPFSMEGEAWMAVFERR